MKSLFGTLAVLTILLAVSATPASADIALFEFALNIDGTVYDSLAGDSLPAQIDTSGFDLATGLGSITITAVGAGPHYVAAYFDHEIDETANTFFNESGEPVGGLPAGLSWEIDEPGFSFGNIYTNFTTRTLDNLNGVPSSAPEDVSMALGWDFALGAEDTGTVNFYLNTTPPASGFYLHQTDPDSPTYPATPPWDVYLSSSYTGITAGVPEPGTILLFVLMGGTAIGTRRLVRR